MSTSDNTLAGKLLIAMPDMSDRRFAGAVIYLCSHSDDGAMGLIVNKPQQQARFSDLLEQLEIPFTAGVPDLRVHYGGPVERQRGFVLHTDDYVLKEGTLEVDGGLCMTATLQVLEDIGQARGPAISLLALGYAGWGAGQLEYEIGQNGWLTCVADPALIFGADNDGKWSAALKLMGIDPLVLSSTAGRA